MTDLTPTELARARALCEKATLDRLPGYEIRSDGSVWSTRHGRLGVGAIRLRDDLLHFLPSRLPRPVRTHPGAGPMTALDLEAARARITELEREVQALVGECAMAYDVIDSLSEEQLALIPDAKLLAALRLMEREQQRDMAETSLQRQLAQARAALAERDAQVARMLSALNWGLGVGAEFPMKREGQGNYWWRPELQRRAGLDYDGERFTIAAASLASRAGEPKGTP